MVGWKAFGVSGTRPGGGLWKKGVENARLFSLSVAQHSICLELREVLTKREGKSLLFLLS